MIGGIIVLALFLTALVAMVVVSQQYENYQATVSLMSQNDIRRFSENLLVLDIAFPATPVSCAGSVLCDQLVMNVTNVANIGTQIARIYVNSSIQGCTSLCILDPAVGATSSKFSSSESFINPSEQYHGVTFWLPSAIGFTNQVPNEISIVTTRGRVFSLQFPIQETGGVAVPPAGGLYLGCVGIHFDPILVTYTSPLRIYPSLIEGAWRFPYTTYLIIYIRVTNICTSYVKLLDKSGFTAIRYTGAGAGRMHAFYLASPMSKDYHDSYFPSSYYIQTNAGNTYPTTQGDILAYNATRQPYGGACPSSDPCYILPPALSKGKQGLSTYLLFSADGIGSSKANQFGLNNPNLYVGFLAMHWQCLQGGPGGEDETCPYGYEFGVTLPFITASTFAGP